jgi:hypothetical protein
LARPNRLKSKATHHQFVPVSPDACRTCANLILPPLDPLAPADEPPPPRDRSEWVDPEIAWVERLDPTHPIRRYPERYGPITKRWMEHKRLTSPPTSVEQR